MHKNLYLDFNQVVMFDHVVPLCKILREKQNKPFSNLTQKILSVLREKTLL
jgi:hypothetical protein